ncbi:hypothetical protein AURDEDRAFT_180597 [Auricularia subglabra TFB-10046 SS5]|nr:hypothetical protein AURDEDRAFT_180597 [Auricularia subglabra TFB-10046 SS5]
MPPTRIPDSFAAKVGPSLSVPETPAAVRRDFVWILRHAVEGFVSRYQSKLGIGPFKQTDNSDLLTACIEWIATAKEDVKILVAIHGLCRVLDRPLVAAISENSEHQGLAARRDFVRELVLSPLLSSFKARAGTISKILFAGTYLPDWVSDSFKTPGLVDLSQLPTLHGFLLAQVETVNGSRGFLGSVCDSIRLDDGPAGSTRARIYSPESIISVTRSLQLVRKQHVGPTPSKEEFCSMVFDKDVSKVFRSHLGRLLFPPVHVHQKARISLDTLLGRPTASFVSPSKLLHNHSTLRLESLYSEKDAAVRFNTICVMHGLLCQQVDDPHVYVVSGLGAKKILEKVRHERYTRRRPTKGVPNPPLLVTKDLAPLKDFLSLTEQSLANSILQYYSELLSHPDNLPVDEHDTQLDLALILRAALLQHFPRGFAHNVQIEFSVRIRSVSTPSGCLEKRGDLLVLIRGKDGQDILYVLELKYFKPGKTQTETCSRKADFAKRLRPKWPFSVIQFCQLLNEMGQLPAHWYNLKRRRPKTVPIQDGPSLTPSEYTDFDTGSKESKNAVAVATSGREQVLGYCDGAVEGVCDEQGYGVGLADSRITDMGTGSTEIVPFIVVNVACALAYVERLPSKSLDRKLAIVDGYSWIEDRTARQVDTIRNAKKHYHSTNPYRPV